MIGKYIYKYGQKVKADTDDKYALVHANWQHQRQQRGS